MMKNFNDIIQQLITVNQQLIDGSIDIEKARVLGQNTQTLVNAARVQLDYAKQTNQTPVFLDEKKPLTGDLQGIGQKAVELAAGAGFLVEDSLPVNLYSDDEEILDKRPFPFNSYA